MKILARGGRGGGGAKRLRESAEGWSLTVQLFCSFQYPIACYHEAAWRLAGEREVAAKAAASVSGNFAAINGHS